MSSFVQRWGMLPPILLFMIFPLTFSLGKLGFQFGPQILFVGLRMFFSGIFLLCCYALFKSKPSAQLQGHDWVLLFYATVFGVGCYIPEFWALKYVSAAQAALIFLTVPFSSALFEWIHGTAKITPQKIIGLLVGICGIIPVLITDDAGYSGFTFPELLIIVASIAYAYGWIAMKRLVKSNPNHSSLYLNGLRMLGGGMLALISSFFLEEWNGITPAVTDWYSYGKYIFLISVIGITCYSFYAFLLRYYSVTMIAFTGFTEPFFAALYAWMLLGETVSWIFFVGLCIVSLGLYLFYQEELRLITK